MPRITFTASGANALVGAFSPGDVVDCCDEFANHFVYVAKNAVFTTDVPRPVTPVPDAKRPKPAKKPPRK